MDQTLSKNDRDWAMYAHAAGLLSLTGFPFAHIIGPLVIYLKTRDESAFASANARTSLNFQITFSIAFVLYAIVGFACFAIFVATSPAAQYERHASAVLFPAWLTFLAIFFVLGIVNIVSCIRGAIAASKGSPFKYPFSIEFVR